MDDWVFASPFVGGEMPYWPNSVYDGAPDDTMREYNGKVVRMALRAS
jgi:hypothetical protein